MLPSAAEFAAKEVAPQQLCSGHEGDFVAERTGHI